MQQSLFQIPFHTAAHVTAALTNQTAQQHATVTQLQPATTAITTVSVIEAFDSCSAADNMRNVCM